MNNTSDTRWHVLSVLGSISDHCAVLIDFLKQYSTFSVSEEIFSIIVDSISSVSVIIHTFPDIIDINLMITWTSMVEATHNIMVLEQMRKGIFGTISGSSP